ncbi:MAG TPA: class A beta-lactamase, partial [Chitinophaga sp.]|uniref:class A beta-lactamase n=1 Tax=Chitinophaga sp. TaxID=1869181 RepID=UPI002B54171D
MLKRTISFSFLFISILSGHTRAQSPLDKAVKEITDSIEAVVGVSACILENGPYYSLNATVHYPMQSVYKFPIAMAVLHQIDKGKLTLDQEFRILPSELMPATGWSPIRDKYPAGNVNLSLRELLRYSVAESDGTACDVLLRILGGPAAADKYVHRLGVKDIAIATTEQVQVGKDLLPQYRNWVTPVALTDLLKIFYTGRVLSDSSYHFLMDIMVNSGPGAKRLKGLLPAGTVVAHKTGSSFTVDGRAAATNDAGIITLPDGRHLLLAVLVKDAHAPLELRER